MDNRRPPPHYAPAPTPSAPPPPAAAAAPAPYTHAHAQLPPAPYTAPPPGPSLPPIQQHHHHHQPPPPPPHQPPPPQHPPHQHHQQTPDHQGRPPFRRPSQQHSHDPRDGLDHYPQYNQHNRSGHGTPVPPVNRSYSHDSGPPHRTPTTPPATAQFPSLPAPNGASQPPPPHHMEHGVHHGYPATNGVPHGLPPSGPHAPPPPHHEQHPQFVAPVMENHHTPYPPPQPPPPPPPQQPMYPQHGFAGPISAGQFQVHRKKQMRATQACEQCRQRKQKCDEGSPCSFCKENNLTCQYRDTPPAKTDKNMEKLMNFVEALHNKVDDMDARLDARLQRVEYANSTQQPVIADQTQFSLQAESSARKGDFTDHRTGAHKLFLLWPSVHPLLMAADITLNDGYVMEAEDRGILRLYTRGEGMDEHDGTQPGGPASPARSEESGGDGSASSPPEGIWGVGFSQPQSNHSRRPEQAYPGGLKADGTLDLDVATVNALYDSYIRHIHVMHPFLDRSRLRKLVDSFIRRYSPGQQPKLRTALSAGQSRSDNGPPLKRQRSNGSTGASFPSFDSNSSSNFRAQMSERSPGNAIVYLVLALGKICLHRDPIPGPVPDLRSGAHSGATHRMAGNGLNRGRSPSSSSTRPSPMSPTSTPATQPTPARDSAGPYQGRSRHSSLDGTSTLSPRNLDIIPGIAYYAKAAEILGEQADGNDLVHAQMFLLAGLYKGQLARVKESMSWFTMAGRAIIMLLERYRLFNVEYWTVYGDVKKQLEEGQSRIKDKRGNLIVLASWTCLQLESDILAELRLPSSGIQNIENLLLMPRGMPLDETYDSFDPEARQDPDDINMLYFYVAQLFMRRRLNQIHREMYGLECLDQSLDQVREMLKGHESILGAWRRGLPPALRWDDADPPASDILAARLRAKYWGARYLVNRPFLDYALHIMPHAKAGAKVRDVARDVNGNPRDKADIHLFEAIEGMGESEIWQASKRCIDAAMQSTVALDGVPGRLIVTGIQGTAHAQFGNLLVLSATYYNRYLNKLVDPIRFRSLLERTILFLVRLGPISPTCKTDCTILQKIHTLIFGAPRDEKELDDSDGAEPLYRNEAAEPVAFLPEPTRGSNSASSSASNSFSTTAF